MTSINPSKNPALFDAPSAQFLALIPAAGVGARMAATCPKQYLHIGQQSILQHSVNAFLNHPKIAHVYVVVSPNDAYVKDELVQNPRLTVLYCGGKTRANSVLNGLQVMAKNEQAHDWALVHDAARPGLTTALITRLIEAITADKNVNSVGGILALPVADTVKLQTMPHENVQKTAETALEKITVKTIPRAGLWLAQTPQMFRINMLIEALTTPTEQEITDEASAIEALGLTPQLIEGHWCNTKITRPDDLSLVAPFLLNVSVNKSGELR